MKKYKKFTLSNLRCYATQQKNNQWEGVCVDLNLRTEAISFNKLQVSMDDMIEGYVETVMDTWDYRSISKLLNRKASFIDWIKYYFI